MSSFAGPGLPGHQRVVDRIRDLDQQLAEEQKALDALKPGEDLVALQFAFEGVEGGDKAEDTE